MSDYATKPVLISIVGPTAVGKTSLAVTLAEELKTEIISADSRQFYRELEIGTAKPTVSELSSIKHHFINSHSIKQFYSAGNYGRDAQEVLQLLFQKRSVAIAVGGSSLYLKALWEGFDDIPEVAASIRTKLNLELKEQGLSVLLTELKIADPEYYDEVDRNNGQRVVRALEVIRGTGGKFSEFRRSIKKECFYDNMKIGLNMNRELLFERINTRMDQMIADGLFDEVKKLIANRSHNALQTVGYSEIFDYLDGKYDKQEAIRLLKRNSRRYAKRQLTWFKKYDDIEWYEPEQQEEIIKRIKIRLASYG